MELPQCGNLSKLHCFLFLLFMRKSGHTRQQSNSCQPTINWGLSVEDNGENKLIKVHSLAHLGD